jgi:Fic family protein
LITLLLLYQFGYHVGRYISVERIIEESKSTYYETLKHSSQKWHEGQHDSYPWLNYFWGVLLRAYSEFEERVGDIRTTKISKTEQIRMAVERRIGPFAISDIEKECPHISRDMIKLVLRDLRDEGLIVVQGKGRGAKWIQCEQAPVNSDE